MPDEKHILVAEDSPTQAIKLALLLQEAGYLPHVAKNGREALEYLESQASDLVISDVMMPEMNGYELCAAIKGDPRLQAIPVILLTSLSEPEDVIAGLENQADYYVTKPYDQSYLLSKVESLLTGMHKVETKGQDLQVTIQGREYRVAADRRQMINLLLSTYENAVLQNRELAHTRDELENANHQLADNLQELAASEQRFRSLVQTVPDIVYRLDPQGRFTYINEAITRLGFKPEELQGQHFSTIIYPSEVDAVSRDKVLPSLKGEQTGHDKAPKLFDERRSGERKTSGLEVKLRCKHSSSYKPGLVQLLGDEVVFAEVSSAGVHENKGSHGDRFFVGTVGVVRDISVRKRMERELELANIELERKVEERTAKLAAANLSLQKEITERKRVESDLQQSLKEIKKAQDEARKMEIQLRQSQKMEALGTLAGGIAHDFNNILSVIMGYAEIATADSHDGHVNPNDLEEILGASERAKGLIRQILTFSHRMEPEFKALDLAQEIETVASLIRKILPKMIEVRLDLAEGLPLINGDPHQIQQMFMNLGTNACDAMPEGGDLIISAKMQVVDAQQCSVCTQSFSGKYVVVAVADTGTGMPPEVQSRIFDPFFTTKEVGKGTGLGLATVFGVVKGHDGHISCETKTGVGSTFKAYFPANDKQAAIAPLKREEPQTPRGNEAILLVDDEEQILAIGAAHLASAGYSVLQANSGEEAIELYAEKHKSIDLVILDLSMPGMGGSKCLEEMLAFAPEAKVIISSGYARDGALQASLSEKTAGLLPKPFSRIEMLGVVRKVLDH
ncbi:MAG: response regulator [Desulfarculaceae bacterium]|nr:response regulator [Desulfarculaceae bacterium]MCF8046160.1 response regulator [Desulfarculaceae bacterium]MCF8065826.1 response regulator [Desulfarculaceae bacterium]MCF8097962.1 response regulator [Desulfarculaceae bacterium]MCF8123991.1 response regulator [Desulfarculaceae bacterium]